MMGSHCNRYFFIALTVLLTVYGQLVLKWQVSLAGAAPAGITPKFLFIGQLLLNPWVISGLGAAFAASLCWMLALTKLPLSTAYPFTSATFLLILFFTTTFMGETFTVAKAVGTVRIVSGIVIMALSGK